MARTTQTKPTLILQEQKDIARIRKLIYTYGKGGAPKTPFHLFCYTIRLFAMAVSVTSFRTRFPEFPATATTPDDPLLAPEEGRAYSDDEVEAMIGVAQNLYNLSDVAVEYLAAHLLVVNDPGDDALVVDRGAGEETSRGRDNSSYKPMADKGQDVFYTTTKYGRTFLALRRADPRITLPLVV